MKNTHVRTPTTYSVFVLLALVAYISRIGELFPFLGMLRINLLLFVLTLSIFFLSGINQSFKWNHNPELKLLFSVLLLGYLSTPFSVWPGYAFSTCNTLLINCMFFLFCQSIINDQQQLFAAVKIVVFSCVLLLFGLIFQPIEVGIGRYTTTHTYDPNDIALLFTFSIPIVLSFYISTKSWGKILSLIVLYGLTLGIIKTGSRGGMIALASVVGLAVCSPKLNLKIFERIFVLICVFMMFFSGNGDRMRERVITLLSGEDYNIEQSDSISGGRLAIWRSGILIFKDNYLLGVGAGNSSVAMGETFGGGHWRTMHNSYLQVAVELGAIAFILFLLMILRIHKNCTESIKTLQSRDNPNNNLMSFAVSLKLSLYGYVIAGFFLSQAYSMTIPLLLAFSSQLKMIVASESDG